jgi:dihydropteroate synthase type 2
MLRDVAAPRLVGIVNVTEDSFSDGGLYVNPERAAEHARRLAAEGADVVEIGPASSHPDAKPVSPREEIRRVGAVLDRLEDLDRPICVDSFQPETQLYAIERNVAYVNDIQGFPDAGLHPPLAGSACRLVLMHSVQRRGRATRIRTDSRTVTDEIERFFVARLSSLESGGVRRDRIVLDPGMGFFLGSNPEPSLTVLRNLPRLKERFGLPLWISVSRKSFLSAITGRPADGLQAATLAAELYAVAQGADYIRTHDVRALRDALAVASALE